MIIKPIRPAWLLLLLLGATGALYSPVWNYPFIRFDDQTYIVENPHVTGGLNWASAAWAWTSFHEGVWNPLTWLSLMLDHELFGLSPGGYHLHNLLLHLASVVVLFLFLRRLTGCPWRSLAVAALFSLHPLNVESVAWISERKNVLSTLLGFLSLWAYSGYVRNPHWSRYAAMAVPFLLSLTAKQMMVTLPCLLLLLDYWPLGRMGRTFPEMRSRFPRLLYEKLPLLIPVVLASALAIRAAGSHGLTFSELKGLPLSARLSNALLSYALYLKKALWPSDLAVFYPHPETGLALSTVLAALLVLAGISTLVWRQHRDHPYLLVGWLWYLGTLFPVIGLLQVGAQAMADRFTYVPLVGIFIMAVWGLADPRVRPRLSRGVGPVVTLAVLAGFGLLTRAQLTYWGDSVSLFRQAARSTPENFLAYNNLGTALLERGMVEEAVEAFSRLLEITPGNARGLYNMGLARKAQGQPERAREYFLKSLERNPNLAEAHNNLGLLWMGQGRFSEARPHFLEALRIAPSLSAAHENFGLLLIREGEIHLAVQHFETALDLNSGRAETYNNLGAALDLQGRRSEAIRLYRTALKMAPDSYLTLNNLGKALMEEGKLQEAAGYFRRAEQSRPDLAEAHFNLGVLFMQQKRFPEALRALKTALRLDPGHQETRRRLEKLADLGYKEPEADPAALSR